jgi:DNA-directed RNA polymerase subunit M/transcription elongation factor TFIIS
MPKKTEENLEPNESESSDNDSEALGDAVDEEELNEVEEEASYTYEDIIREAFPDANEGDMEEITTIELLFTSNEVFYQAVGIIKELGTGKALKLFKEFKEPEQLFFLSELFYEAQMELATEFDILMGRGPKSKAVGDKCPRCKGTNTIGIPRQTRASDEPYTTFFYCLSTLCKNEWRES